MAGHGRPRTSGGRGVFQRAHAAKPPLLRALVVLLAICWAGGTARAETMRVRLAWGGDAARMWHGAVAVSEGTLSDPCPLGVEADEPGSIWLEGGALKIRQRSPRTFDAVDLLVTAPLNAKLRIHFWPAEVPEPAEPKWVEIPLEELRGGQRESQLDQQGSRFVVRRSPGDQLRVRLDRDSLVFWPGERLRMTIEPHLLPVKDNQQVQVQVRLKTARDGRELWAPPAHRVLAGTPVAIPVDVCLPSKEGIYELEITASFQRGLAAPLVRTVVAACRTVQLIVVSRDRPEVPVGDQGDPETIEEIDPANPAWWEQYTRLPKLPGIPESWRGPLGNGSSEVGRHALGKVVQLGPRADGGEVAWEAYFLPIEHPGRPHFLEVDYPSDVPQQMTISIIEPNAAGAAMPPGLDSGVYVPVDVTGTSSSQPQWQTHRLIFWPRTETPLVLITNGGGESAAVYGKIRVREIGEHLPPAFSPEERTGAGRLWAAYMDRPLMAANFSAGESLDSWSRHSYDDWITFYDGASRLAEYLDYVGYNGLMIGVLADGSAIYPSAVLESPLRYDRGMLFASGQDPVRKDVLELLFRLFDREDLRLIPALDFTAPLPELESQLRRPIPDPTGIEWVGPDGATWCETSYRPRGLAPYYNVLDPRVQQAMLTVVRELAQRYRGHRSFAGLAIQLSAQGYAQLLGPEWGMDDRTIQRFERDTRLRVPGDGPERFATRAEFLTQGPQRRLWLKWRADQLARFFALVEAELNAARPTARLYLAGARMFEGPAIQDLLRPSLLQRGTSLADAMLLVGVDVGRYQVETRTVLLRPEHVGPLEPLLPEAAGLEICRMPDVHQWFLDAPVRGALLYHPPREVRVASFDAKSPFQPAYTDLIAQMVPSGQANRRRFVHSVATLDAQQMFDGGSLLAMGQERATRDLVAAFHGLPDARFQTVPAAPGASIQPVTVRSYSDGRDTYVYAVNDAPFPVRVSVWANAPAACRVEELSGKRNVNPLVPQAAGVSWTVDLEPYDLVAVKMTAPGVILSGPQVTLPANLKTRLKQKVQDLGDKATEIRQPKPLGVVQNPGFEEANGNGAIPGWSWPKRPNTVVQVDAKVANTGQQSLRLESAGPVASVVSEPLPPWKTDRLWMSAYIRTADAQRQPRLMLAVEGNVHGRKRYWYASVGAQPPGGPHVDPLATKWERIALRVEGLPLEGLSDLRLRFDLVGAGEVWIDDVEVYDMVLHNREHLELSKMIYNAYVQLQEGQVGDCVRFLEGYWPRLLMNEAPAIETADKPTEVSEKPSRPGVLRRIQGVLPDKLRL